MPVNAHYYVTLPHTVNSARDQAEPWCWRHTARSQRSRSECPCVTKCVSGAQDLRLRSPIGRVRGGGVEGSRSPPAQTVAMVHVLSCCACSAAAPPLPCPSQGSSCGPTPPRTPRQSSVGRSWQYKVPMPHHQFRTCARDGCRVDTQGKVLSPPPSQGLDGRRF